MSTITARREHLTLLWKHRVQFTRKQSTNDVQQYITDRLRQHPASVRLRGRSSLVQDADSY